MTVSRAIDWNALKHAYGAASDIPVLLGQLKAFPLEDSWQSEPWFSLWGALYHQGDIYSASIAAVPIIVATLAAQPVCATLSFYMLPTLIAIADHSRTIATDDDLRNEFVAAILDGPFRLHAGDESGELFEPPCATWVRDVLLSFVAVPITSARFSRDGRLRIAFDDGRHLSVDDGPFEYWHYSNADGARLHGGVGQVS